MSQCTPSSTIIKIFLKLEGGKGSHEAEAQTFTLYLFYSGFCLGQQHLHHGTVIGTK
jgi:hypothetical protein